MYSPKVSEALVPTLYRLAKERKMPMTRLVNGMIRDALVNMSQPVTADGDCSSLQVRESEPRQAVA